MKIIVKGPYGQSDIILPPGYSLWQLKAAIQQSMPQYGQFKLVYEGQDMNDDSLVLDWLDGQTINLVSVNPKPTQYPNIFQSQPQQPSIHMLVNKMPNDNSCLFHAIKRTIGVDLPIPSMRRIIYNTIMGNPIQYTEAVLGKPRQEYAKSMLESAWGGGIELSILTKYFQHEIAVVDIKSGHVDVFAENCGYPWRAFLLYSGIHYDSLELSDGTTKFRPDDQVALNCAKQIARDLQTQRQYTNVQQFSLECESCGVQLKGAKEAERHAELFGHAEFKEI